LSDVIIFGTSTFAEIVHFYLTHDSKYNVTAFTVNKSYMNKKKLFGQPVIPFENIESEYSPNDYTMFIAVGYNKMNKVRANICQEAKKKGYKLISYVNSKATVWNDLTIGENCFIFENNVIQPFVKIGNNVIMWSGNHIGHHSVIEDHCFISSHVVISGNVTIEPNCFLGVNSTIRDGIRIGKESVIGAGTVILENVKEKSVYASQNTKKLLITSDKLEKI